MDDRFSILSQHVFNKSLPDFSVDELVAITEQNPYFTAAQILLLKKLEKGSEAYNSQYQKAILYYHDPVAFDYLVHRDEFENDLKSLTEAPAEEINIDNEEPYDDKLAETDVEIAGNNNSGDVQDYKDEMRSGNSIEEEDKMDLESLERKQLDEITKELTLDEIIDSEDDHYEDIETDIKSEDREAIEELNFSEPELETHVSQPDQFVQETQRTDYKEPDQSSSSGEKELVSGDEQKFLEPTREKNEPPSSLPSVTEEKENDLLFEPFHTVDYFASQGIKITQEEAPKDKFGKQLKSFTEWLKTMKRLPAAEIASSAEKVTDQKIEHMAADSVNSADVVTEAMAEVWLRQGNTEKAIEIYNKLILLYPSKSAYFAAKIDSLKKSN